MNTGWKTAIRAVAAGALFGVLATAAPARANDWFYEDFSGPALDPARWSTANVASGNRWCADVWWEFASGTGIWSDVSTAGCFGVVQPLPYGTVTFTTDADGTTGARFESAYPNRTFPFLVAGPADPRSPLPPRGDFVFETRIRYESLDTHGDGMSLTAWSDFTTVRDNPPGSPAQGVFAIWGGDTHPETYHPIGTWQTYRVEYVGGVYRTFLDGVQIGDPQPSAVRPATIWIGNPVYTWWGVAPWTSFTVDYVRVSVAPTPVQVDIRPGEYPNEINLGSNGAVAVAILGAPTFDASTVDPSTVRLAGAPVRIGGDGLPVASLQDVNADGLLDLVVEVPTAALQLSASATEAVLEGLTNDGIPIRGSDSVHVVQ